MRLLTRIGSTGILLFTAAAFAQPAMHFQVLGEHGAWPQILSSIGFQPSRAAAKLIVIRPGAPVGEDWIERVEKGAFVILEGDSPAATLFGFRPGSKRVRVAGIEDARRPGLSIIWETPIELWPAEKRLALRFELIRKLPNEKNRPHFAQRNLKVLPIGGQQINFTNFLEIFVKRLTLTVGDLFADF